MNPRRALDLATIFPGDNEMARRMRALAWERTDLGSPEAWPGSLRIALGVCLTSRVPMLVLWGRAQILLYNDALIPLLGSSNHPSMLGRSASEARGDVWKMIVPAAERVLADGEGSCSED